MQFAKYIKICYNKNKNNNCQGQEECSYGFYEVSSREMTKLSRTEQSIVKYVIKNMAETAQMSIRELSEKCFVSPATLFRFTKRLGYEGYADFQKALSDTVKSTSAVTIPGIMSSERYRDDYLNNVIEAVKVITDDKMRRFKEIIEKRSFEIETDEEVYK